MATPHDNSQELFGHSKRTLPRTQPGDRIKLYKNSTRLTFTWGTPVTPGTPGPGIGIQHNYYRLNGRLKGVITIDGDPSDRDRSNGDIIEIYSINAVLSQQTRIILHRTPDGKLHRRYLALSGHKGQIFRREGEDRD